MSKFTKYIIVLLSVSVFGICAFNFNDSIEVASLFEESFTHTAPNYATMESVTSQLNNTANLNNQLANANNTQMPNTLGLTDLIDVSKALSGSIDCHYDQSYNCALSDTVTIEYNGVKRTLNNAKASSTGIRADCSGGVSAMLFFAGLSGTKTTVNKLSNYTSSGCCNWGFEVQASTFADVEVGDVLAKAGHAALVVKKDSKYVYTFDWGSSSAMKNCRSRGYDEQYKITDTIHKWRSGTIHVRRKS